MAAWPYIVRATWEEDFFFLEEDIGLHFSEINEGDSEKLSKLAFAQL